MDQMHDIRDVRGEEVEEEESENGVHDEEGQAGVEAEVSSEVAGVLGFGIGILEFDEHLVQ